MMDKIPSDQQIADAIQHKKDMFTSRFIRNNGPKYWDTMDSWYFKHICTVLNHAKSLFETDIDSLASKKINLTPDDR